MVSIVKDVVAKRFDEADYDRHSDGDMLVGHLAL